MYLRSIALLLFLFVSFSCTKSHNSRIPAAVPIYQDHEGLIRITASDAIESGEKHEFAFALENYIENINGKLQEKGPFNISVVDVEDLDGAMYAIDTHVDDLGWHKVVIYRSRQGKTSRLASVHVKKILTILSNKSNFPSLYSFFELMANVRVGDLRAKQSILKLKINALMIYDGDNSDIVLEKTPDLENQEKILNKEIRIHNKERKIQEKSRKDVLKALDKVSADKQFRTLLQNNDREGVANLLAKYLPREHMTPIENKFWDKILYKMKNPASLKERVIMYRGTDGDKLYPAIENGKELTYEEAVKRGKLSAMSTMMTKNQGTWNRRLRSLQAVYDKDFSTYGSSPYLEASRLSTWMKSHASNPQGSMFLSYSANYDVSRRFGKKSVGAFLVDPEFIIFNQMSGYTNEMEYLSTLVTFPDEMISYYDESIDGEKTSSDIKAKFYTSVKNKLYQEYGEEEGRKYFEDMLVKSDQYVDKRRAYMIPETNEFVVEKEVKVKKNLFNNLVAIVTNTEVPEYKKAKMKIEKVDLDKRIPMNGCLNIIHSFK